MTSKEFDRLLDSEFNSFRKEKKEQLLVVSKFANEIGSTQLEDIPYNIQIQVKENALKKLFEDNISTEVLSEFKVFESPKINYYRFKAEFVTSYNPKFEPNNRFGQRKKGNFNWVVDIDEYILIDPEIFNKVRKVYDFARSIDINGYDLKMNTGDLRYLTVKAYNGNSMLIITTANQDERFNQVIEYAKTLGFDSIYWLLNSTKHDSFEGEIVKFVGIEHLTLQVSDYKFLVGPFTFFQNNIYCFEKLIDYLRSFLDKNNYKDKLLFDLYCGVGFLGITLSKYFNKIKGIEIVEESIVLANKNKELNNLSNVEYQSIDFKETNIEQEANSVVIVDPPRNGIEQKGVENLLKINPEVIIYISCNPITLNIDLSTLKNNYEILDLKAFDMFPLTYHLESLCIMKRK